MNRSLEDGNFRRSAPSIEEHNSLVHELYVDAKNLTLSALKSAWNFIKEISDAKHQRDISS